MRAREKRENWIRSKMVRHVFVFVFHSDTNMRDLYQILVAL